MIEEHDGEEVLSEDAFDAIMFAGGSFIWHLLIELDLKERVLSRTRQKLSLGRYGRQPISSWYFVADIDHAMDALTAVMVKEKESSTEDV